MVLENLDLEDGGNEEIKDEDITLDLFKDIFFQMFDQDCDLDSSKGSQRELAKDITTTSIVGG
jgi:hypothetical protein